MQFPAKAPETWGLFYLEMGFLTLVMLSVFADRFLENLDLSAMPNPLDPNMQFNRTIASVLIIAAWPLFMVFLIITLIKGFGWWDD